MGNIIRKICDGNEKDIEMGQLNKKDNPIQEIPITIPPETYAKLLDMINDSTKETIEIKENIKNINHTLETIQCRIGFIEKNNTEKDDIVLTGHKKMIEFMEIFNAKFGPVLKSQQEIVPKSDIKPKINGIDYDSKLLDTPSILEAYRQPSIALPFKSEVLTSRFENKPSIRSRKNINVNNNECYDKDEFNFAYIN